MLFIAKTQLNTHQCVIRAWLNQTHQLAPGGFGCQLVPATPGAFLQFSTEVEMVRIVYFLPSSVCPDDSVLSHFTAGSACLMLVQHPQTWPCLNWKPNRVAMYHSSWAWSETIHMVQRTGAGDSMKSWVFTSAALRWCGKTRHLEKRLSCSACNSIGFALTAHRWL